MLLCPMPPNWVNYILTIRVCSFRHRGSRTLLASISWNLMPAPLVRKWRSSGASRVVWCTCEYRLCSNPSISGKQHLKHWTASKNVYTSAFIWYYSGSAFSYQQLVEEWSRQSWKYRHDRYTVVGRGPPRDTNARSSHTLLWRPGPGVGKGRADLRCLSLLHTCTVHTLVQLTNTNRLCYMSFRLHTWPGQTGRYRTTASHYTHFYNSRVLTYCVIWVLCLTSLSHFSWSGQTGTPFCW